MPLLSSGSGIAGPLSIADKDLHTFETIRSWYSGAGTTMSNTLPLASSRTGTGTQPSPSNSRSPLVQSGYLVAADQSSRSATNGAHAPAADQHIASNSIGGSMTSRSTVRRHWQEQRAHWLNREEVMHAESQLATNLLDTTGYQPDLVVKSRPYKSFPPGHEADPAKWRTPSNAELIAREQAKFDAARDRDRAGPRQRALLMVSSRPEDYGLRHG